MKKNYLAVMIIIIQSAVLIACAAGISQEAQSMVTYTGSFKQVQEHPEKYEGETVIWGGKVIDAKASNGKTELVVVQLDLTSSNKPKGSEISGGRFLIRTDQFLDPAIYSTGTLITVVGDVSGSTVMPIGEMDYRYPVIKPVEIKKWDPAYDVSPRFHFGIGVGTHF